MSKVSRCMCEECHYNDNFECKAEEIEVRSTAVGNVVDSWAGTGCSTFKQSGKKQAEGYNTIR